MATWPTGPGEMVRPISQPDVSVIVPSFNRWDLLSRALASVLAQKGVTLEVLVVDDASSDETAVRLAELDDSRVRTLRQPSNRGVARARNRGIREALAPWVAFLDDDDLWEPHYLQERMDAARSSDARWVYGSTLVVDTAGEALSTLIPPAPAHVDRQLLGTNVVGSPSGVCAQTDLVRAVGGFDEELSAYSDWDLWIRLGQAGRAACSPTASMAYTLHPGNMIVERLDALQSELRYLTRKHQATLDAATTRLGGTDYDIWIAYGYRRAGRRLRAAYLYLLLLPRAPVIAVKGLVLALGGPWLVTRVPKRLLRHVPDTPAWVTNAWSGRVGRPSAGIADFEAADASPSRGE